MHGLPEDFYKEVRLLPDEIKRSYYAIIPANVRYDEDITPNAKLLYGEITALCNERGYCWATNEYFASLYHVSKISVSNWIKQLIGKGYLHSEIIYKEGTKQILNRYLRILYEPIKENFNTPIKENFKDNNTVLNTTVNNKKKKKETGLDKIIADYTNNSELQDSIREFIKMRKSIKKPMTNRALELLLSKLDKLSGSVKGKVDILNQSIFNSWQGIFPLKNSSYASKKESGNNLDSAETWDPKALGLDN